MSPPPDQKTPTTRAAEAKIGRAFRRSLGVLAGAAGLTGLALVVIWVLDREPPAPPDAGPVDLDRLLAAEPLPEPPMVTWRDVAAEAGIDFTHDSGATGDRLLPETMGGGVAVLDYDRDGRFDLLFVDSGPWSTPWPFAEARPGFDTLRLYRNRGDGRFEEVTAAAGLAGDHGYGMGVAVGDVADDGWPDLFLGNVGGNRLFRNEEGRFSDATEAAGVAGGGQTWSSSAAFFDADADGDLDLFVVNYVVWSPAIDFEVDYRLTGIGRAYGPPMNFAGTQPYFYRNDGTGRFAEATEAAGLTVRNAATGEAAGKGLAVVPVDLDDDDDIDLVVANDTVRNFAFLNDGRGVFTEAGTELGLGFDRNGMATGAMGIDAAHPFDDGSLAIGIGNFANEMSSLYVSPDGLGFADEAIGRGIGAPSRAALTFGLFFFDFDLDGRADFLQANGHVENDINRVQASQRYAQPAQLFWNCDCAQSFIEVPAATLGDLAQPIVGRGAAYLDLDNDGALELVLTQIGGPPLLLRRTEAPAHGWLRIQPLTAEDGGAALGAEVRVETMDQTGARVQRQTLMRTRSYLSQVEPVLTFGLGENDVADRVLVRWPDGRQLELDAVPVNQFLRLAPPADD